jgi:hypothetical protein
MFTAAKNRIKAKTAHKTANMDVGYSLFHPYRPLSIASIRKKDPVIG